MSTSTARHVELHNLEVTHHTVTSSRLAGLTKPVRVVVLADLQTDHVGEYERSVFHTMDELRPDLVLLAGDYLQVLTEAEFHAEQPKLRQLFRRWSKIYREKHGKRPKDHYSMR